MTMRQASATLCLRQSWSALRPPPSTASLTLHFQSRTHVTQVKTPQLQKQNSAAVDLSFLKSNDTTETIDWRKINLSQITLPEPRHPEPKLHYEDGRTFFKHPNSRKVYLHTQYTNLLLRHPVLLFFNIFSVDCHALINLRHALVPYGAQIKIIRRRIFLSALRVVQYIEETRPRRHEMWDPSGLAMHAKILSRKRTAEEFEMKSLLKGNQTCAVFFNDFNWRPESIDLVKLLAVIKVLDGTGKTPVLGARFQRMVATAEDLNRLKTVVSVEKVREELVGTLSGPAQVLAGTMSSPGQGLAFVLERRHKAMEEEQEGNS